MLDDSHCSLCISLYNMFLTGIVFTTGSLSATVGQNVSMTCDFSGYLPGAYNITWTGPQGVVIITSGRRTISVGDSVGQSQSGGGSPGPSVLSTLTISTVEEEDHGTYTCLMIGRNNAQIVGKMQLIITLPSSGHYNVDLLWFYIY